MSNDDPKTTKYWQDRGVAPSLAAAAYLDEDPDWKVGDPAAVVRTRSGAVYKVEPDGTLSGGSKNVAGASLSGATPSASNLIRTKCIVVGLQMEFVWNGTRYGTTTVVSVERIPDGNEIRVE